MNYVCFLTVAFSGHGLLSSPLQWGEVWPLLHPPGQEYGPAPLPLDIGPQVNIQGSVSAQGAI